MKKRVAKKAAKRYLDGKGPYKYVERIDEYWDGPSNSVLVHALVFRLPVHREIVMEAYRRGWDGCHWGDPTIEYFEYPDGHLECGPLYIPRRVGRKSCKRPRNDWVGSMQAL